MEDNIIFRKVWEDDCLTELRVTCTSSAASVISNIYVSDDSINELICKIRQFLCSKDNDETSSWTSIGSEDGSVACVSLRFLKKDTLGHIAVEVFADIDDGGSRAEHHSCFFVNTEYGLLMSFCNRLVQLKENPAGYEIQLNYS